MGHQKILDLLNEANDSKFVTRKWNNVNNNLNANYDVGNEINYKTEVLKSNLCYSNAYILIRSDVTVQQLLKHKQHSKIVHHLLNVSHKSMEQQ